MNSIRSSKFWHPWIFLCTDENCCRRMCRVWSEAQQVKHEGTGFVQFVLILSKENSREACTPWFIHTVATSCVPWRLSDYAYLLGRDGNLLWEEHKENRGDKRFRRKYRLLSCLSVFVHYIVGCRAWPFVSWSGLLSRSERCLQAAFFRVQEYMKF